MITGIYPQVSYSETDAGFQCDIDLPGIEKSDIKIKEENGWITVHAIRKYNGKNEKINRSFFAGNATNIKATAKNGVLSITGEFKDKQISVIWE